MTHYHVEGTDEMAQEVTAVVTADSEDEAAEMAREMYDFDFIGDVAEVTIERTATSP